MSSRDVQLKIEDILNKQFTIEYKGYDALEVDQFLDIIVRDYDSYDETIEELKQQIKEIQKDRDSLQAKVDELVFKNKQLEETSTSKTVQSSSTNLSQVDILRRIARLEQEIFNKK